MKFTHSLRPTSPRSTSVLQFFGLPISDHSSSILDPRSRFLIPDPVFPLKPNRKLYCNWSWQYFVFHAHPACNNLVPRVGEELIVSHDASRFISNYHCSSLFPRCSCFPENEKTLGTRMDISYGSHFRKGPKYVCNFWIWSVKVND